MVVRRLLARLLFSRLEKLPIHVAIIPDGNRRWARRRGLPAWAGHYKGYLVMKHVLNILWSLGVRYVTVYALSRENCLRRPREELEKLFQLLHRAYRELERDPRVASGEVSVKTVGDFSLVPKELAEAAARLGERKGEKRLNICLCYSGRWEILKGVKEALTIKPSEIDESSFRRLLPLGDTPDPDLIIRTGGELRLSNFLVWHAAYSELYFTKRLWPDFDDYELAKALYSYSRRERRFGA